MVPAGLLALTVALTSGWHIIGQGQANGKLTVAAASGTAIRPTAIRMKVTATPNIRTVAGYSVQCRKGSRKKKGAGRISGRTPLTKAVALPFANPALCVVVVSATLPRQARLTVTIQAR